MFKNCFLIISTFLLSNSPVFSGTQFFNQMAGIKKFKLCELRYIVRTDALSLFNSLVEKENSDFSLTGELCFNHTFGIQVKSGIVKNKTKNYNYSGYNIGSELRCYLWNEYYSGLHAGIYGRFENGDVEIAFKRFSSPQSIYEGGLCGGYQFMINEHWLIDPAASIGMNKVTRKNKSELMSLYSTQNQSTLVIRVELGVGFLF